MERKLQSITEPRAIALDWLFICLKTYHYPGAENWFEKIVSPATNVVILRNGLDLREPLLPYATANKILPCLVDAPTQFDDATQSFTQQGPARLIIPQHQLSLPLQRLLEAGTITVQLSTDFKTASWEKLIESASLGAITCLTERTCKVFQQKDIWELYRKSLEEGVRVARADGAHIQDNYTDAILEKLKTYPPQKGSSMLSDRLAGRPIEVMAKSGIISQKAKKLGISAPLHDSFTALLQGINNQD